jgi:protein involved in sex pheromone biosynthesis
MKKSLILFTLTSTLFLTACSSKKQAESSTAETANLSPTSLYDVDKKVFDLKDITSKHKVTYVDFWAN